MTKKGPSSGHFVSNAVHSEKRSGAAVDLSRLRDILVKSPGWKKKAIQGIEAAQAHEPAGADALQLKNALLDLIDRHWPQLVSASNTSDADEPDAGGVDTPAVNDEHARAADAELARRVEERDAEIERLQDCIAALGAENERISELLRQEVDSRKAELQLLHTAFSQFQQESDQLLSELDQENAYLLSDKRP